MPFAVVGPNVQKNSYSSVPVTGLDILPTLADLAGYKEKLPDALELFDLSNDVSEENDLAEKMPEKVKELDEKLVSFMNRVPAEKKQTIKGKSDD